MKKGFTLIELLAVIVILAIIALIATPLILNVIDDSKKGAFKSTAYGIIEAAELNYAQSILNGVKEEKSYVYENGEQISPQGTMLEFKGNKPQNGEVKTSKNGKVAIAIHDGKYCIEKNFGESEVRISDTPLEECVLMQTSSETICGEIFIDIRDNEEYKTVKIGNQCWMAENLRYTGNGCLGNVWDNTAPHNACRNHTASIGTEGYLDWTEPQVTYQFGAAMNSSEGEGVEGAQGVCPNGWHLPTNLEWTELEGYVDSTYDADASAWNTIGWRGDDTGTKLKSSTYWDGIDEYGFNALPVGDRLADDNVRSVGETATFWTSTFNNFNSIKVRIMNTTNPNSFYSYYVGYGGNSIRCVLN